MNYKEYAEKLFFEFLQLTKNENDALECCFVAIKYISHESDSRFIDFFDNVKIEFELMKKY